MRPGTDDDVLAALEKAAEQAKAAKDALDRATGGR